MLKRTPPSSPYSTGLPIGERLWIDDPRELARRQAAAGDPWIAEALNSMVTNGYCVLKGAISREICDAAIDAAQSWIAENADKLPEDRPRPGKPPRVTNLHLDRPEIADLFTKSSTALGVQDYLFGHRSSVYTSLYFNYGTEQPIHRDVPVFHTMPENFYFGVWYALEAADHGNGNLMVIPGAHKTAFVDQYSLAESQDLDLDHIPAAGGPLWQVYQREVLQQCMERKLSVVEVPLDKGDVLIWHPLLPHGGVAIHSPDRTRHSVVFHVVPEGVPVYQADVFFDRRKKQSSNISSFEYYEYDDRIFCEFRKARFGPT